MAKTLSDRVGHFFTINEFKQVTETAYRGVELHVQGKTVRLMSAPGILLEEGPLDQVRHKCTRRHESRPGGEHAARRPDHRFARARAGRHGGDARAEHRLVPESQYWSPRLLHELWKPTEIYITENGCAAADEIAKDGNLYDYDRVMYLRNGMMWQQRATAEGIPIKGNFYWSTMDDFEWINGFGDRFGLVHVDFETQKRTPKLSARWYREAARRNAIV